MESIVLCSKLETEIIWWIFSLLCALAQRLTTIMLMLLYIRAKKGTKKKNKEFKQQHEKSIWELFTQLNGNGCVVVVVYICLHGVSFPPYVQKFAAFSMNAVVLLLLFTCAPQTISIILYVGAISCTCVCACVYFDLSKFIVCWLLSLWQPYENSVCVLTIYVHAFV